MSPHPLAPAALFELGSFAHAALFQDAVYAWEALGRIGPYLATLTTGVRGEVAAGAWLIGGGIHIDEGTVVEAGAYIQGPCVIGRDCEVRHGAYLRGNVVVGDRCVIGHATEVKGSIFLDDAKAGHFAYVGDSILGANVNLGAGTKLANLRLDRRAIVISLAGDRIDSGRRKLGAILGDGAETGCNSVTNPGSILGVRARLFPCAVASGYNGPDCVIGAPTAHVTLREVSQDSHVDTT